MCLVVGFLDHTLVLWVFECLHTLGVEMSGLGFKDNHDLWASMKKDERRGKGRSKPWHAMSGAEALCLGCRGLREMMPQQAPRLKALPAQAGDLGSAPWTRRNVDGDFEQQVI